MKKRKYKMNGFKFTAIQCAVCGKMTQGRLPREGGHKGDGTFWFPRRHKIGGLDCAGNVQEGIIIE